MGLYACCCNTVQLRQIDIVRGAVSIFVLQTTLKTDKCAVNTFQRTKSLPSSFSYILS